MIRYVVSPLGFRGCVTPLKGTACNFYYYRLHTSGQSNCHKCKINYVRVVKQISREPIIFEAHFVSTAKVRIIMINLVRRANFALHLISHGMIISDYLRDREDIDKLQTMRAALVVV